MNFLDICQASVEEWRGMFEPPGGGEVPLCDPALTYTKLTVPAPKPLCVTVEPHDSAEGSRPERPLNARERDIVRQLAESPTLESEVAWMRSRSLNELIGAPAEQRLSGRVIDALMTKYPRFHDVHYYVDVTDPDHTRFVPREQYAEYLGKNPQCRLSLLNISSAYTTYMNSYSKSCFDPFGRGREVTVRLSSGGEVTFSLCRLMYFRWARKFHVFDYLRHNYDKIASVQREDQSRQRQHRASQKDDGAAGTHARHKPRLKFRCVTAAVCNDIPAISDEAAKRLFGRKRKRIATPEGGEECMQGG